MCAREREESGERAGEERTEKAEVVCVRGEERRGEGGIGEHRRGEEERGEERRA